MLTFDPGPERIEPGTMCNPQLRNTQTYHPSRIVRTNCRCPHMRSSSASIRAISRRYPMRHGLNQIAMNRR
jgi:hypothetical protein